MKDMTLGLLVEDNKILLGMKKRGFGEGRWNGFGGKVNDGETIEDAMMREFLEESGIRVIKYKKAGIIDFEFKDNPEVLRVHIFRILEKLGNPREGEEMRPQWFDIDKIPFEEMWSDDKFWMPMFLNNRKFEGKILFKDEEIILDYKLEEIG